MIHIMDFFFPLMSVPAASTEDDIMNIIHILLNAELVPPILGTHLQSGDFIDLLNRGVEHVGVYI